MSDRIKELAEQAGLEVDESVLIGNIFDIYFPEGYHTEIIERFAELVRQDEREACAKFIEDFEPESFYLGQLKNAAAAIRARSKHD